jgi:uncharacterized protein YndB with AHSA1/START domain
VPDILHRLVIRASPAQVYCALTTPDGLAAWWTRDVTAEPTVGSVALFGFNRRDVTFRMFVQELAEAARVRWYCLGGHPEWKDTEIAFALSQATDGTVVDFAHRGWKSSDGIFAVCNFDWARYLASLKAYLETGAGAPHAG